MPATITVNGNSITVPQVLLAQAAFGVGFRLHTGTPASKFTIVTSVVVPSTGAPTISPAFYYIGVNG